MISQCLEGIFEQTLADQLEVIVVDSGSTDGTLEILKKFPVRIKQIPSKDFNHGSTRNLGVSMARGEFIVMTVQDAIPVEDQWLERMISHFDDPEVAGVCGQQIVPHERDKNPHEWFRPVNPPSVRSYQFKDFADFEKLTSEEKRWICGWDDVNACYRASVLKTELPFSTIKFGEDLDWATNAYKRGYKLIFDPACRVYHYHKYSYKSYYSRQLLEVELEYRLFNLYPKTSFSLGEFLLIFYRNIRYKASIYWLFYNWMLILANWKANWDFHKLIKKSGIK